LSKADPIADRRQLCGAKNPIQSITASPLKHPVKPLEYVELVSQLRFSAKTISLADVSNKLNRHLVGILRELVPKQLTKRILNDPSEME
jgi:hypothetical protein